MRQYARCVYLPAHCVYADCNGCAQGQVYTQQWLGSKADSANLAVVRHSTSKAFFCPLHGIPKVQLSKPSTYWVFTAFSKSPL